MAEVRPYRLVGPRPFPIRSFASREAADEALSKLAARVGEKRSHSWHVERDIRWRPRSQDQHSADHG